MLDGYHASNSTASIPISNSTVNFVELKFARTNLYKLDDRQVKYITEFTGLVNKQDSLFMKRLRLQEKIRKLGEIDYGLLDIYETVNGCISDDDILAFTKNNPAMNIEALNDKYEIKYPLIKHLNSYRFGDMVHDLAQYINFMDSI